MTSQEAKGSPASFLPPGSDFGPLLHAHTDIIVLVVAEILASTLNSLCSWVGHQTYWGVFAWTRGIYIHITFIRNCNDELVCIVHGGEDGGES